MPKDDWVYVGHMLDMARKARQALRGKSRAGYDADEVLRLGLAHLWQTVTGDLPPLIELLEGLQPPEGAPSE